LGHLWRPGNGQRTHEQPNKIIRTWLVAKPRWNNKSFSYALFDLGETELPGYVHIEPSVELEVGADISWWVIGWLLDSPSSRRLTAPSSHGSSRSGPFPPATLATVEEQGSVTTTRRSEVCEWCVTCCVWPAQAYCNKFGAAHRLTFGKESPR
jgi:hypothetical protein